LKFMNRNLGSFRFRQNLSFGRFLFNYKAEPWISSSNLIEPCRAQPFNGKSAQKRMILAISFKKAWSYLLRARTLFEMQAKFQ